MNSEGASLDAPTHAFHEQSQQPRTSPEIYSYSLGLRRVAIARRGKIRESADVGLGVLAIAPFLHLTKSESIQWKRVRSCGPRA